LTSCYSNDVGGVSDYVINLSKALSTDSNILVLTSYPNDNFYRRNNLKIGPRIENWGILGLYKLVNIIMKNKPDYILMQYVPYMYSSIGIPYSIAVLSTILRLRGVKIITTFHEISRSIDIHSFKYLFISICQRIIAYIISLNSLKIVLTLEKYRELLKYFNHKINIIPVGTNILPVHCNDTELNNLKFKITKSDEYIISTISTNIQRIEILLRIIAILKKKPFPVKLIIIGKLNHNDVEDIIYKYGVSENIIITGYIESSSAYRYLKISDLFVFLGVYNDKFGFAGVSTKNTSVIAAYSAGLPVSGIKGYMSDDFFVHLKDIYYFSNTDEESIANSIKSILTDSSLVTKLSKGSLETYKTRLSWQVIASQYLELLT
jgi:glycosyltransferase involved in cell wall biosynthesis